MNLYNPGVADEIYVGKRSFHNFNNAAKIIGKKGLGRNSLLKLLREKNVLDKWNHPTKEFEDMDFFKIVDNRHMTPLISSYGINYIKKYLI